jgi:outer membrane protein assembly factor BamB
MGGNLRRPGRISAALAGLTLVAALGATGVTSAGASGIDWPAYENGPQHSSYNPAATAVTTANAAGMNLAWKFVPPPLGSLGSKILSSPTVYQGNVYFGSENGTFYDLNETTGAVVWSQFIGQQPKLTCPARSFVATATVAPDPTSGNPTVYEAAPDGYLYAWNAANGALLWRSVVAIPSTTENDYFNWSSPTVANGKIYIGVASSCDAPLVQGGERIYDQATGAVLASFQSNPTGDLGGDIWSSALVTTDGSVFVSTGNQQSKGAIGDSQSIIHLDPNTLAALDIFTVPAADRVGDGDFGSSPTVWTADIGGTPTQVVGACNKNGKFYALKQSSLSAGPVWTDQLGTPEKTAGTNSICVSSAVWDSDHAKLYLSGNVTTIGGVTYRGSVQEVNPATGTPIWQTGLPGSVLGTPTLDGSGVMAVATADFSGAPNAVYLIDASTGSIISTLSTGNTPDFAQPVFADNYVLVATAGNALYAYQAPATPPPPSVTGVSPASGPTTGGTSVTITGAGFTGATAVDFGSNPATTFTVNSSTSITATTPAGAAGTVGVSVTTANGTSPPSTAAQFTYGTSVSLVLSPASITGDGSSTSTATATVTDGSGNPVTNATVTITSNGTQTIGVVTNNNNGTYSATITSSTATGSFTITATDTSVTPNVSATAILSQTGSSSLPTITAISPTSGPYSGGTSVTITGTNFVGVTNVRFGSSQAASWNVVSPTQIVAVAPSAQGSTKATNITVTNNVGVSAHVTADVFTYVWPVPVVTSVVPNAGPAKGGTSVTITGSGFTPARGVKFGGTAASSFNVISDTEIVATSPAGTGKVNVTVSSPGGTSAHVAGDIFVYGTSVSLSLSPTSIPSDGTSTSTATVTVVDVNGNPVTNANITVTTSGNQTIGPVTNNNDGTYTAVITASTTAGPVTITATDTSVSTHPMDAATLTST